MTQPHPIPPLVTQLLLAGAKPTPRAHHPFCQACNPFTSLLSSFSASTSTLKCEASLY